MYGVKIPGKSVGCDRGLVGEEEEVKKRQSEEQRHGGQPEE
jgi:hypothetical protein